MQKKIIEQAFSLVNEQRSLQRANQIFCFQNQARALDGAIMAQFFPDCVKNHLKPRPTDPNMPTQHVATLLGATSFETSQT